MAEFQLIVEPAETVVFEGGAAEIRMTSVLGRPVAYKIKCTDNALFKIEPAVGMISADPEESVSVNLLFTGTSPVPEQSFAVSYVWADGMADAKSAWDTASGNEPTKTLSVSFA